ncbi:MAG: hypothetical protein KGO96_09235 [Elusimicrobia bacterium]|nr:hypothetical protein [Elusimicrobiota bacterium]MDE2237204.1 hypothetical protein [Elusimicrobiota bacterium]MDE2426072.1 hypothetical protein [Elusimicrobiota bacterium]
MTALRGALLAGALALCSPALAAPGGKPKPKPAAKPAAVAPAKPAVSWKVQIEDPGAGKKFKNWLQVDFIANRKNYYLAFRREWLKPAKENLKRFAPTLDSKNFQLAVPLFQLKRLRSSGSEAKKAVTFFQASPTPFHLYWYHKGDKRRYSVKRDKKEDDFVAYLPNGASVGHPIIKTLSHEVYGKNEDGTAKDSEDRPILVEVLPPAAPAAAGKPGAKPAGSNPAAPSTLSSYELAAIKSLKAMPYESSHHQYDAAKSACRAAESDPKKAPCWRQQLALALKRVGKLDRPAGALSGWEQAYVKARLGASDFKAYQSQFEAAQDAALKTLVQRWRKTIDEETAGYLSAASPSSYNPSALEALLAPVHEAGAPSPTSTETPLQKTVAALLPSSSMAERVAVEFRYRDPAHPTQPNARLKALAKSKNANEIDALKKAAKIDVGRLLDGQKDPAMAGFAGYARQRGVADDDLLAYYCGDRPNGLTPLPPLIPAKPGPAAGSSQTLGVLTQTAHSGTPVGGAGRLDTPVSATTKTEPGSNAQKKCEDYWNRHPTAGQPAPDLTVQSTLPELEKGVPQATGKDSGPAATKASEKNPYRDLIAGAKIGIWAAIIGGALMGPGGAVLLGLAGVGLGYWMSQYSHRK